MSVLSLLLLIAGALLGAVAAIALLRPNRERMRDELKAISLDVLQRTGDSLAQRVAEARRAEEERSAGEMAKRAEEIKGLVGPVQEKLGRMESEIGRLERERREAQGELAQMLRQLGEGVGTLRQETGNLVSALKRPATRGSWGELQLRRCVLHALRLRRAEHHPDGRRDAPARHARAAAREQARGRGLEGAARCLPVSARGPR